MNIDMSFSGNLINTLYDSEGYIFVSNHSERQMLWCDLISSLVQKLSYSVFTIRLLRSKDIRSCCGFHDKVCSPTISSEETRTNVGETSTFYIVLVMTQSYSGRLTITNSGIESLCIHRIFLFQILR